MEVSQYRFFKSVLRPLYLRENAIIITFTGAYLIFERTLSDIHGRDVFSFFEIFKFMPFLLTQTNDSLSFRIESCCEVY